MIKSRRGGHDDRPRPRQTQQILQMDLVHRRLTRYEEEPPPLLQRHIRCAREEIIRHAVRDGSCGLHRAGHDDHRIHAERAARDRCPHVRIRIEHGHAPRQFLRRYAALIVQHAHTALCDDSVHLDAAFREHLDEAEGIAAAARPRDADDDFFHRMTVTPCMYGTSAFGTMTEPSSC